MSIYESKPRKTYAVGATAQAAFAVPFVFWVASDIRVYVDDVRLTSGYTVTGDWSWGDVSRARRMIPFQNLFFVRWLFDQAEAGAAEELELPAERSRGR